jgi:hypothetical protein
VTKIFAFEKKKNQIKFKMGCGGSSEARTPEEVDPGYKVNNNNSNNVNKKSYHPLISGKLRMAIF